MDRHDEVMLDLFIQPGWKVLMSELEQVQRALVETVHNLDSERELWKRKGEIQQVSLFLSYESNLRHAIGEREKDAEFPQ